MVIFHTRQDIGEDSSAEPILFEGDSLTYEEYVEERIQVVKVTCFALGTGMLVTSSYAVYLLALKYCKCCRGKKHLNKNLCSLGIVMAVLGFVYNTISFIDNMTLVYLPDKSWVWV